jgi:immune inhibitor A
MDIPKNMVILIAGQWFSDISGRCYFSKMTQFDPPQSIQKSTSKTIYWIIGGGCLVIFACLIITAVFGIAAYFYWDSTLSSTQVADIQLTRDAHATQRAEPVITAVPQATVPVPEVDPTDAPAPTLEPTLTATPESSLSVPPPEHIDQRPIPEQAWVDLKILLTRNYPSNDYYETAIRLGKLELGERTVHAPAYRVGDVQTFYNAADRVDATLMVVSEHAYFWVENKLALDQTAVSAAADRFEREYYPYIINLFGDVWTPGIDNDPRFSILHVSAGTDDELGRFNSTDEFPRALFNQSNEQELLYMNLSTLDLGSDLYFGTLVHELQHLIQWYVDPSEALWVNEGLSQLAEIYVGLNTADTYDYLVNPETRLNSWNFDEEHVYAHYAGAYLFMVYLWEQLGDVAIQEYSRHPSNGMAGIHAILEGYMPEKTLEQFVADWAVANYLDDRAAGEEYFYNSLDFRRPAFIAEAAEIPFTRESDLDQYGVHYIDLNELRGDVTIRFVGDTLAELTSTSPRSGSKMWFAPSVDELNAQLTGSFDLTELKSATLKYAVWYDLEFDYDYAYVSISTDGGQNWDLLTPDNAVAGEFGPAYNGRSTENNDAFEGWIKESVSLNAYVGHPILVRFDVLTDYDTSQRGFALDDISIPELSYATDAEFEGDGWQATGFVQVGWQLPQQWRVQLIQDGPEPTVEVLPLNARNQGEWHVEIGKGGGVLVITPLTPFINEPANYWLQIE